MAMVGPDKREVGTLDIQPPIRRVVSMSLEEALGRVQQGTLSASVLYEQLPPTWTKAIDALARTEHGSDWASLTAESKRQVLAGVQKALGERAAAESAAAAIESEVKRLLDQQKPAEAVQYANSQVERLYAQGDLAQSWALAGRARDLAAGCLEGDHPATAQSLNNLAVLHNVRREFEEARRLCVEAYQMRCRTIGARSRDAAESLGNLGFAQAALGALEDARRSYSQALEVYRALGLEDDPDYAIFRKQHETLSEGAAGRGA